MKTILIAIVGLMPLVANAQTVARPAPSLQVSEAPVQSMLTAPNQAMGWYFIATSYGPPIPAGWQIVNIEALMQNGNSMTAWLVYLYNPATRQTAGWLVGLN